MREPPNDERTPRYNKLIHEVAQKPVNQGTDDFLRACEALADVERELSLAQAELRAAREMYARKSTTPIPEGWKALLTELRDWRKIPALRIDMLIRDALAAAPKPPDQRLGADSPTGLVGLANQTSEPPSNKVEKQFSPCEHAPGVQSAPATPIPEGWRALLDALKPIIDYTRARKEGALHDHGDYSLVGYGEFSITMADLGALLGAYDALTAEPPPVCSEGVNQGQGARSNHYRP